MMTYTFKHSLVGMSLSIFALLIPSTGFTMDSKEIDQEKERSVHTQGNDCTLLSPDPDKDALRRFRNLISWDLSDQLPRLVELYKTLSPEARTQANQELLIIHSWDTPKHQRYILTVSTATTAVKA